MPMACLSVYGRSGELYVEYDYYMGFLFSKPLCVHMAKFLHNSKYKAPLLLHMTTNFPWKNFVFTHSTHILPLPYPWKKLMCVIYL
jgi:hypothetical protein